MKPLPLHYWNFPRCSGKCPTVLSDKCSKFLRDVISELAKYPEIGPGVVGRVVREIQCQHLAPHTCHNVGSKYGPWTLPPNYLRSVGCGRSWWSLRYTKSQSERPSRA